MIQKKMIEDGDLRILWRSAPIVGDPVVVRNDLNKDFVKKVQQAYLDMNTERPDILKKFVKLFLKDTSKRTYMVARDSSYNGLRQIANSMKDLKAN
jgi:phosphonate transport system substrate-binding protein